MAEARAAMLVLIGERRWYKARCEELLGMAWRDAERHGLAMWMDRSSAERLRGRHRRLAVLAQPGAMRTLPGNVERELRMLVTMNGEASVSEVQGMAAGLLDLLALKELGR